MARPLRIEFPGALYHVTSRGNARQRVFRDDEDRETFLATLAWVVERFKWRCHAMGLSKVTAFAYYLCRWGKVTMCCTLILIARPATVNCSCNLNYGCEHMATEDITRSAPPSPTSSSD